MIILHPRAFSDRTLESVADWADSLGRSLGQDGRGNITLEERRNAAVAYLRQRGRYILDPGTPQPGWGHRTPRDDA